MKIENIIALGLCIHTGLSMPHAFHHKHKELHAKRTLAPAISTITEVVTVTDYNAVVWVDSAGNVIKTEHKTPEPTSTEVPIQTSPTSASSVIEATSAPMVTPVPASSVAPNSPSASVVNSVSSSVPPTSAAGGAAKALPLPQDVSDSSTSSSSEADPTSESAPSQSSSSASTYPTNQGSNQGNNQGGALAGFGVAYDAWDGSGCRSSLDSEFALLAAQGVSNIRIYDVCFAESVNAAAAHGLKLMIGITSFDNFDNSLEKLVDEVTSTAAGWSVVDTVFAGNELVNSNLASPQTVADKVSYTRGILRTKGYTGNVVTVDTWVRMRDDSTICSTSDYCAANAHAFFDGNVLPENAGQFVRNAADAVGSRNSGKRVVISESGWPHAGAAEGVSVPSVENQRTAMASIVSAFSGNAGDMYLFMAFDAKYKINEPEVEMNFGIFDADHFDSTV